MAKNELVALSSKQILSDFYEKHYPRVLFGEDDKLMALIRYARHVGYNEGWKDATAECKSSIAAELSELFKGN